MTRIYLEQDGNRFSVSCKDHAETEAGCAAISAICCTLAGYLHNTECRIEQEQLDSGNVLLVFTGGEAVQAAFDMACVGFLQLQKDYPGEASVTVSESL